MPPEAAESSSIPPHPFRPTVDRIELGGAVLMFGLLSAVAFVHQQSLLARADRFSDMDELRAVRGAIDSFRHDTGLYPACLSDLFAPKAPSNGLDPASGPRPLAPALWQGPYLQAIKASPRVVSRFRYGCEPTTKVCTVDQESGEIPR